MPVSYDAAIIGAGLSGLTLANRLAESSWAGRRILIVDDAGHDLRMRTWAYWTPRPIGLSATESGAWDAIAVHASGSSALLPLRPYRYVAISGALLHDTLNSRLSVTPHYEFVTGSADAIREGGDHAVITIDGADVTATWAFDSRPLTPAPSSPRLVFLGWEIDTDTEAFDPAVATFMDFRGREAGTVSFCYVLPTTARHALVEIAAFQWSLDGPDLACALTHYLRHVCGLTAWAVTRTEGGSLPLARPPTSARRDRVIPIGVRGGMLKASTGFAVERIQRHSASIVRSLDHFGHPYAVDAPRRRHAWLDSVFLDVLRRDPDIVEAVMARLFIRNGAPAVLRFLDEDSDALPARRAPPGAVAPRRSGRTTDHRPRGDGALHQS
jgi:lycopene beta-cyclase